MTSKYYIHSWPSTIGGTLAIGGATALLIRDGINTGFTLDHALMPVLVGLTVLFGHECYRALKELKIISAAGFAALAVFGSGIIVTETMGRRAEVRDAKVASESKGVDQFAALMANLNRANQLEAEAESWVANECKTGLGPKCRGVTYTRDQRRAHAEKLRAEAEAHKAPAPVDAKASRIAALAVLVGITEDAGKAKTVVQTFDPYSLSLFLELGGIFGFGFGVRHRKVSQFPTVSDSFQAQETKAFSVEKTPTDEEIEELKKLYGKQTAPVTNDQLASLMGISKSEASKRRQKAVNAGIIQEWKAGKFTYSCLV